MSKKDAKKNLLSHSKAKVRLLGEYLNRYLNVICNDGFTERIEVHDLFCGQGIYEDGGEGSPLIILKAINDLNENNVAKLKKIPKIDTFFNDINKNNVQKLKKSIEKNTFHNEKYGSISFTVEDYAVKVDELVARLNTFKNKKAFIFIDPYEYKHIKISQIQRLLANKKTEVLLWLPTQHMYRFEKNATPKVLKDFIEELVPDEEWPNSQHVWQFLTTLRDRFQQALGDDYYVDNFKIEKDKNTVYSLFFFTSHIRGFEKMLEAKWEIDTEFGVGWHYTGNLPSLFFDHKTNPLEEKLKSFLAAGPRTNGEIYLFTLQNGFLPKHTNEIFREWQNNSLLSVTPPSGSARVKKGAFYVNYNNYKSDFDKVKIERK